MANMAKNAYWPSIGHLDHVGGDLMGKQTVKQLQKECDSLSSLATFQVNKINALQRKIDALERRIDKLEKQVRQPSTMV